MSFQREGDLIFTSNNWIKGNDALKLRDWLTDTFDEVSDEKADSVL